MHVVCRLVKAEQHPYRLFVLFVGPFCLCCMMLELVAIVACTCWSSAALRVMVEGSCVR